jgi:hypothetical protein
MLSFTCRTYHIEFEPREKAGVSLSSTYAQNLIFFAVLFLFLCLNKENNNLNNLISRLTKIIELEFDHEFYIYESISNTSFKLVSSSSLMPT